MDEVLKIDRRQSAAAAARRGDGVDFAFGELTLTVEPARIVEVLTFLRDDPDCQFVCFIDISAVDYPEREKRFDVVYHLLSPKHEPCACGSRSRPTRRRRCPRAIAVFPAADWYEREVYDLFGVLFDGHPGSAPHPHRLRLRGSSAAQGFPDDRLRRGALRRGGEARALRAGAAHQEFRQFDFLSPWEGAPLPGDEKAKAMASSA